ncbi:hypothetical protein [Streptomyces sp. NPDC046925]|uniref:hypothetical protein n=1 Tax=Streptomyces sp. NPDC046925 TaxID=3155375 RepID=UPI0034026CDC
MKGWPCQVQGTQSCTHSGCDPQPEGFGAATVADVLPQYHATVRISPADEEVLYEIAAHGPAAFVAHVVTSVADAFEEDAQR